MPLARAAHLSCTRVHYWAFSCSSSSARLLMRVALGGPTLDLLLTCLLRLFAGATAFAHVR